MSPRPHWKGYLKLSLVSCPIALYPAISPAERISFRQVNRATGNRLRHQLVDAVTGEAVESHNKGRGYEVGENRFLLVDDEELEAAREAKPVPAMLAGPVPVVRASAPVRAPSGRHAAPPPEEPPTEIPSPRPRLESRTIEIEKFVPRVQIHPRYQEKPYFIVPCDQVGQEAFAVIREAMRGKEMVGTGRVVLSARERPIALEPMGQGLCGITLHCRNELRSEAEYFAEIPQIVLPDEMLRVAEHILETKKADFDPSMLEDHYQNAGGDGFPTPMRAAPGNLRIGRLHRHCRRLGYPLALGQPEPQLFEAMVEHFGLRQGGQGNLPSISPLGADVIR